jgi:hypothetical protein
MGRKGTVSEEGHTGRASALAADLLGIVADGEDGPASDAAAALDWLRCRGGRAPCAAGEGPRTEANDGGRELLAGRATPGDTRHSG